MRLLQRLVKNLPPVIGVLALVAEGFSYAIFAYHAYQTAILPKRYTIAALVVLFIIFLISFGLLMKRGLKKGFRVMGILCMALVIAGSSIGTYYLYHSKKAIDSVANITQESTTYGVYVRNDSSYETIQELKDVTFAGLKSEEDGKNREVMDEIEIAVKDGIETTFYEDALTLVDALEAEEVETIFLNEAYMDVITEIEGYEEVGDDLRLVEEYTIENEVATEDTDVEPGEPFLMYISGMDTWGHITTASRSDVNILAAVNPQTKQILLVSTPRDYYVPLSISNGVGDKLTHAGIYGIEVSEDTMEMLYGVNIDYYLKLNFSGFEGLIDAMGGITVWSDYDFTVEPIKHYVVGDNELTGLEALAFARERHAFENGDRQRGINQMNVIQSVIDKMTSTALIKNYKEIMEECEGTFATDMTSEEMASWIAYQISDGGSWDIQKYSVNGTGATKSVYSLSKAVYVMEPNYDDVALGTELIEKVLNGETVDVATYTEE